jgi:DNA-binding transcriptional regulator LsrR (DeoR family)
MTRTVVVTSEQVEDAKAAIAIAGGVDKVPPLIAMIAAARPRSFYQSDEPDGADHSE